MTVLGSAGWVAMALCLVAGAACSSDDGKALPAPQASSSTTSTTPLDFSQVALAPVAPGKPPPVTRPPGPGRASIAGRVIDTTGAPVAQALVRATYFFDPSKPDVIEAISGADGRFRFDRLLGGRWRIRAWLTPVLATLEQPAFFLGAAEQKTLDLKVKAVPDLDVTSKMAPDPPLVGWPAELAVLVVSQTVDPEGKVVRTPLGATDVTLALASSWSLGGAAATQPTEADGTARWTMYCGDEGVHAAKLVVAGREFPITLPSCLSPASTTTATTTTTGPSTSSTKPRAKATTTTTRPRSSSSTRPGVQPR
jgi:hypothetical protein